MALTWKFTHLPTIISSISEAFLRILLQMSIVKIVDPLLNMEVSDDIRADIITANIKPKKYAASRYAKVEVEEC